MKELLIISGLSGSGKSTAARVLEEQGFRVVEAIPASIIPTYMDYFASAKADKEVLVVPIDEAKEVIEAAKATGKAEIDVLLLYCSKKELLTRFRLTRHNHPFEMVGLSLEDAIERDIEYYQEARPLADQVIDTSGLAASDLRRMLFLLVGQDTGKVKVLLSSFGYKYGVPEDADIIFDTRIVPNPFWEKELSDLNGNDQPVIDFLEAKPTAHLVFKEMVHYLDFYLSESARDHKGSLSIYVGCTGGQHRSVYFVNKLFEEYKNKYECVVVHRNLNRDSD
ncbi:MAG: RNase adapter RapZ [Bacillota bacterium]|nr:RNase adapter RapZ [Bacillota bacterium]